MSSVSSSSVLRAENAEYIAHLFALYLENNSLVDPSWQAFFADLGDSDLSILKEMNGASWTREENRKSSYGFGSSQALENVTIANDSPKKPAASSQDLQAAAYDSIRAVRLIRAYRNRGHFAADLDPLKLAQKLDLPELQPSHYGFQASDYNRPIYLNGTLGFESATLTQILARLQQIYAQTIGYEYLHLSDPAEIKWLQDRIENPEFTVQLSNEERKSVLKQLAAAEGFEKFLHTKYVGAKRFGVDGGESTIPATEEILATSAKYGVQEVVFGMAHRGRLNILTNVLGKSFTAVFSEFQGKSAYPDSVQGSGDVKYHLGTSSDRIISGQQVHLSLTANPSHLEAVNPVALGKSRAKQDQLNDTDRSKVLTILYHGDAAFAGQGLVAESLMLSDLAGYTTGGTMHVVINNQIGFTTMPQYSRSGHYSTDIAKMLTAPIFHVNGDDPDAVIKVSRLAAQFRAEFKKDVVIDLTCYRRFGHNEGDEPAFTQPIMYKAIRAQESVRTLYAKKLVAEQVLTQAEYESYIKDFNDKLEQDFEKSQSFEPKEADMLKGKWSDFKIAEGDIRRGTTALKPEIFPILKQTLTHIPDGFAINPKIERQLAAKAEMFDTGNDIDWGTGEAMAFGSLLHEGYIVRLSGQDVGRGTFSHRHAIMYDQETGGRYIPLSTIAKDRAFFDVHDSPLSEAAVLGFEYGYSLAEPNALVLWEGQFGDFVNGAQVMIDQFISSAESKWLRMSGLVMLLPHGMEGQGPEHSSGRPERFLQNAAEDNWQIANCTTPANYFHILRRQMHRDFRKPLVVFTPKSLLRHKLAVSKLHEFGEGSSFHRFLWDDDKDTLKAPAKIKRVVLCTGKVYFDLLEERRKRKIDDIYLLRIEQLYPFPEKTLAEELATFKNAEFVWCQEEHQNQGYWNFVDRRIENTLTLAGHKGKRPRYIGREEAAAPATGLMKRHVAQQEKLVNEALTV
jgi:2-oxoglutarate dehydrogenase E1 component